MNSASNHPAGISLGQGSKPPNLTPPSGSLPVTPSLTSRPVAHSSPLSYDVRNATERSSSVGEFGDKFRQAREKKELSLDDVSNVTKISSRMLQAIEEEHFDQLPGGVFNKGFIRAYAKHLGLNSDDAVSDYLACLRQAQIDSHAGWDASSGNGRVAPAPLKSPEHPIAKPAPKVQPPHSSEPVEELPELQLPRAEHIRGGKKEYLSRQPSGPPWALIAAAVLVVVLAIFFWTRHPRASTTAAKATAPPAAPVIASAASPTTSAPTSSAPSSSPAPAAPAAAPVQTQSTTSSAVAASQTTNVPPTPDSQQSTDSEDLPVARPSKQATTPASADPTQVKVERKGDVTIRSFGAATSKPTEKSASTLTLVVRASENSWISVTSDGQLLTQETLIAPAATSFHASRELVVRVGNAAGISFLWKGEEVPPQGAESEAKTFTFDAQGMHASTPQ
jgi:cytoskeletal protein RodZ